MSCWTVKNLQAITIGSCVPSGRFLVKIHSVFKKAINLQLIEHQKEKDHAIQRRQLLTDGRLITILNSELIDYPQSIHVISCEDFTSYGLKSDDDGNLNTCRIMLNPSSTAVPICVSLTGAIKLKYQYLPKIFDFDYELQSSISMLAIMQKQANVVLRIEALVSERTTLNGTTDPLVDAAANLGESVHSESISKLYDATLRLIGFGPGLTPSGDDFLCGFITAAYCKPNIRDVHLLTINQIVLANLTKTNAISATFLRCAINGEVCSALYDFAQAIQFKTNPEKPLNQLCTIGHSSGMDVATGFLYGLKIWNGKQS